MIWAADRATVTSAPARLLLHRPEQVGGGGVDGARRPQLAGKGPAGRRGLADQHLARPLQARQLEVHQADGAGTPMANSMRRGPVLALPVDHAGQGSARRPRRRAPPGCGRSAPAGPADSRDQHVLRRSPVVAVAEGAAASWQRFSCPLLQKRQARQGMQGASPPGPRETSVYCSRAGADVDHHAGDLVAQDAGRRDAADHAPAVDAQVGPRRRRRARS